MDKSMDNENITDEQTPSISKEVYSTKLRSKERSHSQTTPTNTDINDPENLDYEDIDDNHPVKKIHDEAKSSTDIQDEEGEVSNNPTEINNTSSSSIPNNPEMASDEGEVNEADLEDGEIHDPSTTKIKNSSSNDQSEQNSNRMNTSVSSSPQSKVHCRYYLHGRCHWGQNCKYNHPNNDSTKISTTTPIDNLSSTNNDISPPTSASIPQTTTNTWISPQATTVTSQFFPNPLLRGPIPPSNLPLVPPTGTESAWERGLRSAKTLREQSMRRKQQDKDFNDKKFNLTIRDALDEKEIDDNLLNIDRPSSIDYDANDYPDQRNYSDRYHPYMYPSSSNNSHYNNHQRINNNSRHNNLSLPNEHSDRRTRHSDDYNNNNNNNNNNRNRKEKSSIKDSKSTSKRDDSSSYKRNSSQQQFSSGSHHTNDEELHLNNYSNRRGDDWHDPWDRSRNHNINTTRRSSGGGGGGVSSSGGGGRQPSYSSSSASSSSSSRSSRSRSHSTSSSSRSRSRSRPKRRSPSVTRATATTKSSEMNKNGNDKKSNGNKKLISPSSTATNKFLPGRQISSHTLKKAEKSSNTNKSTTNNNSKDQHEKDSDKNTKKQIKKENINRSDSTSSSSSSDSDINRKRSSSSSSDSSSSENESRTKTKAKTSIDGPKAISSSSGGGGGGSGKKSKNDSVIHRSSKSKESSTKKRRDTSSSTGSTSATKKTKLNTDSHKTPTDANNAENSDSSKKKEKQKILKKLQEVEKLINQRSTKTSS